MFKTCHSHIDAQARNRHGRIMQNNTEIQSSADIDLKPLANCVRALAMDAVQAAKSGHPGMPMGMADVATVLYAKFMKFDPKNPLWANRDRFVLSAGHGSMLLYGLNYLTGYDGISLEDIKNFRQLESITAGHPEYDIEAGVETTTGPLGQGIATAAGMALGERIINARNGKTDHYTYVIAGDGCMQEGISHEACSLAGHLKLDKLIILYDDNGISIDGSTDLSFTDDTPKRFEAYGWDVQSIDGHDYGAIETAIAKARKTNTPSLICCKTHIGYGAPTKQDSASSHGSPLGEDEIKGAKDNLNWPYGPFEIPDDVLNQWRTIGENGAQGEDTSEKSVLPNISDAAAPIIADMKTYFATEKPKMATRATSGKVLDKLVPAIEELIGGSADLTGSNNTKASDDIVAAGDYSGQYIHYGVREHGMAAMMNGMAQYGGIVPYSGTFLVFTDYCRPAIRLSALMEKRVVYVMTHDSIGLGEDGPTHQPVEHLASLRAMPNLNVFRPCDGIETAECWEIALSTIKTPSIMALSRQGLPTLCDDRADNMSAKGAYILQDCDGEPDVTLFATGSEVQLAVEAAEKIDANVRVVSVPCLDLFWQQDGDYIASIICNSSYKIAIEAAVRQSWDRIIGGHNGTFIGMDSFGASAPIDDLYNYFGITVDAIVKAADKYLNAKSDKV